MSLAQALWDIYSQELYLNMLTPNSQLGGSAKWTVYDIHCCFVCVSVQRSLFCVSGVLKSNVKKRSKKKKVSCY
jgi:hypothetical protein